MVAVWFILFEFVNLICGLSGGVSAHWLGRMGA